MKKVCFAIVVFLFLGSPGFAQPIKPGAVWSYTLLQGSYLIDVCTSATSPPIV